MHSLPSQTGAAHARHGNKWRMLSASVVCALCACVFSMPYASAAVTPQAVMGWGENAADDIMQFLNFTAPSTYTDRGNSIDVTTETNNIQWVKGETAPTRDEVIFGHLKDGGRLNIIRCVDGCNASGDWTADLNIADVSAAQFCDATDGSCWRVFDIAYEQLSGDAVVFYGKAASDGILYYNVWNGTEWAGESSYEFRSGSTFDTRFIRAVAKGQGMADHRTDDILLILGDSDQDIFAMIWNGDALGNQTTIDDDGGLYVDQVRCFDGAWEGSTDMAMVVYCNGDADTTSHSYKMWDGDSWDVSGTELFAFGGSSQGKWVTLRTHRGSDRMCVALMKNGNDFSWGVWKTDGSTPGWTEGTQDNSIENDRADGASCAWENNNNGTPFALATSTDSSSVDISKYETWTQVGGFSGRTDLPGAMGDDGSQWLLYSAPNEDAIMGISSDIDADLHTQRWDGSIWESGPTEHSTSLGDGANGARERGAYDWTYRFYSPWSRNWRFFDDETTNDPSTGLNGTAENAQPTDVDPEEVIRLRMQFIELGTLSQTDSRKKLQFTSGCNPNTSGANTCAWTDVGDTVETSAVWRYATSGESCASCSDGTTISAVRLTGTTQNGTYISDTDAAAGAAMDHDGSAIVEYDYPLKAENVSDGTTYYFRAYDLDQMFPLYRRQDTGTTDCLGTTCTYPGLTISGGAAPAPRQHWGKMWLPFGF